MTKRPSEKNGLVALFTNEFNVMIIILLNTLVLFFYEFKEIRLQTSGVLIWIDYACIIYFVIEALLKIKIDGWKTYISQGWNRFDFSVVIASLPSLLMPFFPEGSMDAFIVVSVLRLGRLFRFFRLLRFIPNIQHIMDGILRALRASIGIFFALVILNLALSIGATMLFSDLSEQHFGNPLRSAYSLFKVFTIEGWYEIPDQISEADPAGTMGMVLRAYFIFTVLVGGILGVSLANAVFVDEMTADNTRKVEDMVSDMHNELLNMQKESLQENQAQLAQLQQQMSEVKAVLQQLKKNEN